MPAVVFTVLEAAFVWLAYRYLQPLVQGSFAGGGELLALAGTLASWLTVAVTAALGFILALVFTPPLSAPALERIVDVVERDLRAPERVPLGVFAEFWCGFRSTLVSLAVTLPLIVGLTLLELVFAPLAVVATPLKLLLAALSVAWNLFDYPLTLRGIGARQRFELMKRNIGVVLGFGTAFALVFWLPCCSVVMLPIGVVAATKLVWEIQSEPPPPALRAHP